MEQTIGAIGECQYSFIKGEGKYKVLIIGQSMIEMEVAGLQEKYLFGQNLNASVRLKLESILSPDREMGNLELADIVDAQAIQSLMNDFYKLAHIPIGIIDLKGNVLVGVGWQDICTRFHRVHPETSRNCFESDTRLTEGVPPGEFRVYKCKNHMWDVATPLMVAGHHVGNLFSGQFFFEDELKEIENALHKLHAERGA